MAMTIRRLNGEYETLNLEQEIEFLHSELQHYSDKRLQLCKYLNYKDDISTSIEYQTYDPDRCITMYNISEELFSLLLANNYFKIKKNTNKNRESVLQTSNVVDVETLKSILLACGRKAIIDEILVKL